jgi:hypothetical protein
VRLRVDSAYIRSPIGKIGTTGKFPRMVRAVCHFAAQVIGAVLVVLSTWDLAQAQDTPAQFSYGNWQAEETNDPFPAGSPMSPNSPGMGSTQEGHNLEPTMLAAQTGAQARGWGSLTVEPSYDDSFLPATRPPSPSEILPEPTSGALAERMLISREGAPYEVRQTSAAGNVRSPSHIRFLQAPPNYQTAPSVDLFVGRPIDEPPDGGWWYDYDVLGRAYYYNDQRIEWTGQEATFGVEGVVAGAARQHHDGWEWGADAEIFLNQPFDRNILVDTPLRQSYRGNFEVEPFQISQLYISGRAGDFFAAVGRMATPFGRTYFPLYLNSLTDAPFIRSEAILWRETGLLLQYDPGNWIFTAAVTNGGPERDTNSSKALVSRIGYEVDWFALGSSIKWHDGISSEGQKTYNNHFGIDAMLRRGRWMLSGEAIFDQYGMRRAFDPQNITWGRSIYHRDFNEGWYDPIEGIGYYVNFGYHGDRWTTILNYGEYYPEQIGDRIHDTTNRRGILKVIYNFSQHCEFYSMLLLETDVPRAQEGRLRNGEALLAGFQFTL